MPLTECESTTSNVAVDGDSDGVSQPVLTIHVTDELHAITDRLTSVDGDLLTGDAIDVTYRYKADRATREDDGVIGITENTTGGYIVEAVMNINDFLAFVEAAKNYADTTGNAPYTLRITTPDEAVYREEKRVLLVYSRRGSLIRARSLIPNDIEI